MKASILFLGVFTAGILTGMHVDWNSWLFGLATGVSIFDLALPPVKRWLHERD